MKELVIATNNLHKLEEFRQLLHGVKLHSLKEVGFVSEIEETGQTFQENSAIKARAVFDLVKLPVLADDSGLEVKALQGAPGVYSARYAGVKATDTQNTDKLLREMAHITERDAAFVCVLTFLDEQGLHQFEGRVEGDILQQVNGTGGFGYDPVFQPKGWSRSFAAATPEEKNAISHRSRALQAFLQWYQG